MFPNTRFFSSLSFSPRKVISHDKSRRENPVHTYTVVKDSCWIKKKDRLTNWTPWWMEWRNLVSYNKKTVPMYSSFFFLLLRYILSFFLSAMKSMEHPKDHKTILTLQTNRVWNKLYLFRCKQTSSYVRLRNILLL